MRAKPNRVSPDLLPSETIDLAIGSNVRRIRKLRKQSLHSLGGAVGVTAQQIHNYELGGHRISCSTLQRIGNALDCSITEFYQSLPGFEEISAGAEPQWTRSGDMIAAQAIDRVPDRIVRQNVRDLITALASSRT